MPNPSNTKEYHESYLKKKKQKIDEKFKSNCSTNKNYRKSKHC